MNAVVVTGDPVPVVLKAGDSESAAVGRVAGGVTLDIEKVSDGTTYWGKVALNAGSVQLLGASTTEQLYGYIAGDHFVGGLDPEPTASMQLGVAVVFSEDSARQAANLGCRFFSVINNVDMASRLKDSFPDATIMVRPGIDIRGALPGIDYMLNRLGGAKDPRLIYSGINEADQIGQAASDMSLRSSFDAELARRIKAISGATYAAGSFSVGTPDFTSMSVCSAIQQYYAPYYNAGLFWMDHHLYSPNMSHIYRNDTQTPIWNGSPQTIVEHEWYETRWHFFFKRCGFDPNSTSRIICSETGMDEGSVGGFAAHNATNEDVLNWCNRFLEIQSQTIKVDNTEYASPFVGGAIFQVGDPTGWAGYDMTRYEASLSTTVWAQLKSKVYVPVVTK